jgi:PAS domain S-box-containing protein
LNAERLLWTSPSFFEVAEYHFYSALSRAASFDSATDDSRQRHFAALAAHQKQLEIWAQHCPENFENRAALVGAEIARIEGRVLEAEHLYEQAIRAAHTNGFVHNEAIAYKLAARFYAARGFQKFADAYLLEARYCYQRWGADGKVAQLDHLYPHLKKEWLISTPTSTILAPTELLDLATVIKVSQAVSGEMVLEKLIDMLMRTAIEHAGAERGLLILPRGDELRIASEATTSGDSVIVGPREASVAAVALPESIVHYVVRAQESVILDDASAENPFSADTYVRQHHARSILCLPLINQAKLIAVLYLENNLTSHVFTPTRISVLKLLASQAAISLESARLYRDTQQMEAYLKAAQTLSNTGSFGWRPGTGEINWSDETYQIMGYERGTKPTLELVFQRIHPEDTGLVQEAIDRATLDGTDLDFEHRLLLPDGAVKSVYILAHAVKDESGNIEYVGAIMDITERNLAAEEALRKSEERWRAVFENSAIGVALTDLKGRLLVTNSAYQKMLGYTEEEFSKLTFLELTHEDYREANWKLITELLEGKRKQFQIEKQYWRKDGTLIWVSNNVSLVPGTKSMPQFIMALSEDITARKQAEEAARESERRYHEVEMAHANRIATIGQLSASIAHEVNQPLGAIVNNASACLRWLTAQKLEEARQTAALVVADGHRAGEIIARIRALAKKAPPQKEWLDVNETIHEVIALARSEIQRNGVALETQLSEHVPLILADRIELQQVILNLVMNAVEAMSGLSDGPRELLVRSGTDESDQVVISVQDSGPGIDPENLGHLFDAFYTTKPQGMGMGLAISRSIVESHGGRLWATANDDRGATFQFTLPVEKSVEGGGSRVRVEGTNESAGSGAVRSVPKSTAVG